MKKILAIILIAIGIFTAVSSRDLEQKNPETIFLTNDGLKDYEKFKKETNEKISLIVQFQSNKEDSKFRVAYLNLSEKIKKNFSKDFLFVDPSLFIDLKKTNLTDAQKINDEIIKLISNNSLTLLAFEKHDETDFKPLIQFIESNSKDFKSANFAGSPYTNYLLDQYSYKIKTVLFPLLFITAFFILLFITKSIRISVLTFIPSIFSATISLWFIQKLFGTMNLVSSSTPLIVFTINLSLGFHLLYNLQHYKSLSQTIKLKIKPIALMLITTAIGLGSLILSPIQAIVEFGYLSIFTIVLTSLYSFLWFYVFEHSFIKYKVNLKIPFLKEKYFKNSFSKNWIWTLNILSIVSIIFFAPKLPILTDATRYFPKELRIKEKISKVYESVLGIPLFELVVKNEDLEKIEFFKRNLNVNQGLSQIYKVLSPDYMPLKINSLQKKLTTEQLSYIENSIQNNEDIISVYSSDSDLKRITILGKEINFSDYKNDLAIIKNNLNIAKISNYDIDGLYYHLMFSQKAMLDILIYSFLSSVFIIALMAFVILKSIKVFYIFIVINIAPIFLSFSIIYLLGYSLNIATVKTYSIALGIIVDATYHTIHVLQNPRIDFKTYYSTTIIPIVASSILFILCFLIFAFDPFIPIKEFGVNLSIILFIGLIYDVYVLPTLLTGTTKISEVLK